MGRETEKFPSLKTLLTELSAMITAIIATIMENIITELLTLLWSKLTPLLDKLKTIITLEQITFYRELMKRLISACSFSFPLFGHRNNLDTQLDVVNYADIDEIETPQIDEC